MTGPGRGSGRLLLLGSPWRCQTGLISCRDVCAGRSVVSWVSVNGTAVSCASWFSSQAENAGARCRRLCGGAHSTVSCSEQDVGAARHYIARLCNVVPLSSPGLEPGSSSDGETNLSPMWFDAQKRHRVTPRMLPATSGRGHRFLSLCRARVGGGLESRPFGREPSRQTRRT